MTYSNISSERKEGKKPLRPADKSELLKDYSKFLDDNAERVLSPQTKRLYITVVRRFLEQKEPYLLVESVNTYVRERTREKSSDYVRFPFKKLFEMLGRPFDWTIVTKTARKPPKKRGNYVPEGTLNALITAIEDPKWQLVAIIQKETGARASEVLALKGSDIIVNDVGDAEIHFWDRKGKKNRVIYLHPNVGEYLMGLGEQEDLFMPRKKYKSEAEYLRILRTQYRYYLAALKKAAGKVGIPLFATHDFRRNMARRVYRSTKDALATQKFLGHTSMDTTERYIGDIEIDTKAILKKVKESLKEGKA